MVFDGGCVRNLWCREHVWVWATGVGCAWSSQGVCWPVGWLEFGWPDAVRHEREEEAVWAVRQGGRPTAPHCQSATASEWSCSQTLMIKTAVCMRRVSLVQVVKVPTVWAGFPAAIVCASGGLCFASGSPFCGKSPPSVAWYALPVGPTLASCSPARRLQAEPHSPAKLVQSVCFHLGSSCMVVFLAPDCWGSIHLHHHQQRQQQCGSPYGRECRGRTDQELLLVQ